MRRERVGIEQGVMEEKMGDQEAKDYGNHPNE